MNTAAKLGAAAAAAFVLIQFLPLGVESRPVRQEVSWDSPATAELAQRACMDCHSNQGDTPWYGHVAPVSWVVGHHIDEAREHMNLSEMDRPQRDADEAGEELEEGEMPPKYYLLTHPDARLSETERAQLVAGLNATLGSEEGGEHEEGEEHGGHDDDDD